MLPEFPLLLMYINADTGESKSFAPSTSFVYSESLFYFLMPENHYFSGIRVLLPVYFISQIFILPFWPLETLPNAFRVLVVCHPVPYSLKSVSCERVSPMMATEFLHLNTALIVFAQGQWRSIAGKVTGGCILKCDQTLLYQNEQWAVFKSFYSFF